MKNLICQRCLKVFSSQERENLYRYRTSIGCFYSFPYSETSNAFRWNTLQRKKETIFAHAKTIVLLLLLILPKKYIKQNSPNYILCLWQTSVCVCTNQNTQILFLTKSVNTIISYDSFIIDNIEVNSRKCTAQCRDERFTF